MGLLEVSAIQELTNIGLGNAATALAELVGRPLMITVPTAGEMALERIPDLLGGPEEPSIAVSMGVSGDLDGILSFVMHRNEARRLARAVSHQVLGSPDQPEELEKSLFLEVGNIIDSSFLTAIAEMTGARALSTTPVMVEDMAATVVSSIEALAAGESSEGLMFETSLVDSDESIVGFFIYLPTARTLQTVLRCLGLTEAA
jgi:chemotaxis protein CheC